VPPLASLTKAGYEYTLAISHELRGTMIRNIRKFRDKLAAGRLCLGAGVSFSDPAVTEALCDSVDFLWIDLEHSAISLESLQAHLIAARAGGAPALVRVPGGDVAWVKRVLDSGAEGVILPQVHTAADAEAFVAACRYPPLGRRGYGPRRPSNYGRHGGTEYLEEANRDLFVAVQIETAEALAAVDAIVRVPGLDGLVIGPADLGCSLGIPLQLSHPRITAAIASVCARARQAGLSVGIGMGPDVEYAVRVAGLGVQWVQCGGDYSFMLRSADAVYAQIRGRLREGDAPNQGTGVARPT
jgi:2-keto-3-deoxy-L-rhamnonate aldolase RhmA